jgi:hypothetical protein
MKKSAPELPLESAPLPLFDFSDPAMSGTVRRMHVYMQTVMSFESALLSSCDSRLTTLGEKVR